MNNLIEIYYLFIVICAIIHIVTYGGVVLNIPEKWVLRWCYFLFINVFIILIIEGVRCYYG